MRYLYGEAQQKRTSLRCRPNRRIIIWRLLSSIEVGDAEAAREIERLYPLRCRTERMLRERPPSGSVAAMTSSSPFLRSRTAHVSLFPTAAVGSFIFAARSAGILDIRPPASRSMIIRNSHRQSLLSLRAELLGARHRWRAGELA